MLCPFCRNDNDRVIDSRAGDDGNSIRRRRECLACRRRFTTYERVERQTLAVVKKGGIREPFDRDKLKRGLAKACWKRPVTEDDIEAAVSSLEGELYGSYDDAALLVGAPRPTTCRRPADGPDERPNRCAAPSAVPTTTG